MTRLFICTLFTLSLLACGNDNKNTANIDGLAFDSVVVDTTASLTKEKGSPQCHVRLNVQYAKGENERKINQTILHSSTVLPDYFFIGHKAMDIPTATKTFVNRLVEDYIQDYGKLYRQDKEHSASYNYDYVVNTSTRNGDDGILIYEARIYTFGGGPYGTNQTVVQNINVKTGEPVKLSNIFVPGYEKTLEEIILDKVLERFKAKDIEALRKQYIFADGRVYASENFMLDKDKITFIYCESEIAPHETGEIRIEVKKSEMKDILK